MRQSIRLRIANLLGEIRDGAGRIYDRWILHPHDLFIVWLWQTVHHRADARTVAQVFVPTSRAQQALDAMELQIERWVQENPVLQGIANCVEWWEERSPRAKFLCMAAASFGIGAVYQWWCGKPFVFPDTIFLGFALLIAAGVVGGAFCVGAIVVLSAARLVIQLWRMAELINNFVMRHLLPHGPAWRYRAWQLRRIGRRVMRGARSA